MPKIAIQGMYTRRAQGKIDFVVKSDIMGMLCCKWDVTDLL